MAPAIPRNPFIESIFTADPSAHTWDGERVYVYASHDIDPARGCDLMDRYHVFSSDDMVHWTDEGEILGSDDVTWGRPEGGFMWAPDCAFRNGTYYFYYPHPSETRWNDTWKIGVATSTHPHKDFTDKGYIDGLGGFALIDPCVIIDDDGQAYIYIGGGARCMGAKLKEDMMTLETAPEDMTGLYDFHEATWVFKRNGVYYLTYSDNHQPCNHMRYATSDHPLGPWTHRGIYLEPTDCETSHGSVMAFKGQWYQFYHNSRISGQGNLRSICVDPLYFNEDGTIQMVKQSNDGLVCHRTPDNATVYEAASLDPFGGAEYQPGDGYITHLQADGAGFTLPHADGKTGGRATIWVRYATADKWAKIRLHVNGKDESFINALATDGQTDGYTRLTVKLNAGTDNTLTFTGGQGDLSVSAVIISYFED